MISNEPFKGVVLVELLGEFGNIPTVVKEHTTLTSGTIIAVNKADEEEYGFLVGRTAYWRKYKDDARIGKNGCFIDIKDILGSSYEDTSGTDRAGTAATKDSKS